MPGAKIHILSQGTDWWPMWCAVGLVSVRTAVLLVYVPGGGTVCLHTSYRCSAFDKLDSHLLTRLLIQSLLDEAERSLVQVFHLRQGGMSTKVSAWAGLRTRDSGHQTGVASTFWYLGWFSRGSGF